MSPRNRSEVKGQTSLRLSTGHRGQTSLLSASATSLQSTSTLSEAITHVSLTEKRFSNAQISLFNWIFKFCRDEFAVHLEGNAKSHMNRTVTCRSAAITHRLQPNLLKSKSGKLYQLQGPICRLSCEMLGEPQYGEIAFFSLSINTKFQVTPGGSLMSFSTGFPRIGRL